MSQAPENPRKGWADRKHNVELIVKSLYVICGILLFADLFYTKHGHFSFENWFGFFAFYGFLSYFCIVTSAKYLRKLVKRDESYYD